MSTVTVEVSRGLEGLGIEVNSDNLVVSETDQPDLNVGDVVISVDGEPLAGRKLSAVLDQESSTYTFEVSRDPAKCLPALERALLQLGTGLEQPSVDELEDEQRARIHGVVAALEDMAAAAAPANPLEAMQGFWKLILGAGPGTTAGCSGMAAGSDCSLVAQWQAFSDKEPSCQVVEIIADPLLGRNNVAALKGSAEVGAAPPPDVEDRPSGVAGLTETYTRTEVGGSLSTSDAKVLSRRCTYLSAQARICRPAGKGAVVGDFSIYWKTTADAAQLEIARLADAKVGNAAEEEEDIPLWERRLRDDNYDDEALSEIP